MKYQNAAAVLPEEVLRGIQDHFQGGLLYIPRKTEEKAKWGCTNGAREYYARRNRQIQDAYLEHFSIEELAERFGLSESTIRKIIYR